jgi:hypothetical protein
MKVSTKETKQKYKEMSKNTCSSLATTSRDGADNKLEVPDNGLDGRNQSLNVEDSRMIWLMLGTMIPTVLVVLSSENTKVHCNTIEGLLSIQRIAHNNYT